MIYTVDKILIIYEIIYIMSNLFNLVNNYFIICMIILDIKISLGLFGK